MIEMSIANEQNPIRFSDEPGVSRNLNGEMRSCFSTIQKIKTNIKYTFSSIPRRRLPISFVSLYASYKNHIK